jgi:predicted AAA+ superfamily ATPase
MLKQAHASTKSSIYLSLDTLDRETDLFELVERLSTNYHFEVFFLDEVHFLDNIDRDLKKIFDFLSVKLVFTSSVSLKLVESAHDLSRRVKLIKLLPFSFREFLNFNSLPCPPAISWGDLVSRKFTAEHSKIIPYLSHYISGGNFPFSLEVSDILGALRNNLEKIIKSDIPRLQRLNIDEIDLIFKAFKFIARSSVSDINANTIANNLKITRYKAAQYLNLLEEAFVIKQVQPIGTNLLKEPKILLQLPYRLLELDYKSALGGLREDFAADCLTSAGIDFGYLKSTTGQKTPDFMISSEGASAIIEIGGGTKGFKQFKGIENNIKKLLFVEQAGVAEDRIPLAYLGLLER